MSNIKVRSQQVLGYRTQPTRSGTVVVTVWNDGVRDYATTWGNMNGSSQIEQHGRVCPPIDHYAPGPVITPEESK